MNLFELFQQTYDWNLIHSTDEETMYRFESEDGLEYEVSFGPTPRGRNKELGIPSEEQAHALDFGVVSSYGNIEYGEVGGVKNPYMVFATVFDIATDFIKRTNPQHIVFTSSISKRKLYARMVRTLVDRFNLTARQVSFFGSQGWLLTRKD